MAKMMVSPVMAETVANVSPTLATVDGPSKRLVAGFDCPAAKSAASGVCAHCACGMASSAARGGSVVTVPSYAALKTPRGAQHMPGVSTIPDPSPPRLHFLS